MAISNVSEVMVEAIGPMFEKEYESHVKDMGKSFGNFFATLRREKLKPKGVMMCTYLTDPDEVDDDKWRYKIAVKVDRETENTVVYPEHKALKLTVTGSYSQFEEAYKKIGYYIESNGDEVVAPPYEVYVKGPKLGFIMLGLVSEVRFPVK